MHAARRRRRSSLDGFELSASAGWAVFPTQAANSTELFERADHALAQAKIGGQGRLEVGPDRRADAAGQLTSRSFPVSTS